MQNMQKIIYINFFSNFTKRKIKIIGKNKQNCSSIDNDQVCRRGLNSSEVAEYSTLVFQKKIFDTKNIELKDEFAKSFKAVGNK